MMRIIAHWEGRSPVLTPSGTFTVVMMGTVAGTIGGMIHALLLRFVRSALLRLALFGVFAVLFTLYAVRELLIRPRLLFVAIMIVYVVVLELLSRTQRVREVAIDS